MEERELNNIFRMVDKLFTEDELESLAFLFKALAHPVRLKILFLLYHAKDKKVCVGNLVELLGLNQPNVS